jgi:hypothetical protein
MCIRNDVSHCSLQGNPPPPPPKKSLEDCGRSFMWSDCVSLHAAVTISKTRLVASCGQTPALYCILHILIHNGKRHRLVVLCLFWYQRIKGKKCIQKWLLRIQKVLSHSLEWLNGSLYSVYKNVDCKPYFCFIFRRKSPIPHHFTLNCALPRGL